MRTKYFTEHTANGKKGQHMNPQEKLLRQIYACRFVSWELKQEPPLTPAAQQKQLAAERELRQLTADYERLYGPLQQTAESISRWAWTAGPFQQ